MTKRRADEDRIPGIADIEPPKEVERLPGCGVKIAELFREWRLTGSLREIGDAESNPKLSVLKLFYDIWGVGDATAREFYKMGPYPLGSSQPPPRLTELSW